MKHIQREIIALLLCFTLFFPLFNLIQPLHSVGTFKITATAHANGYGSVELDWAEYDYSDMYFKAYKSDDGVNFQTTGIDYKDVTEVKCLQIYPQSYAANQMKNWCQNTTYGKGIIKVDSVSLDVFNANPQNYLYKDSNGKWSYDVIFFGTVDGTANRDIGANTLPVIESFIKSGKGCIFGHDTINNPNHQNFNGSNRNYATLQKYVNVTNHNTYYHDGVAGEGVTSVGNTKVVIRKKGLFTTYPNYIGDVGTVLTIPFSHNIAESANSYIWLSFQSTTLYPTSSNKNHYLTTYNNCAFIQTGHSSGSSTAQEQMILSNLIFYCNQLLFNGYKFNDPSAMDVANPNAPVITVEDLNINWTATDNGSDYWFYVESFDKNDTTSEAVIDRSNTEKINVTTGVQKYVYIIDNNVATVATKTNGTETIDTTMPINVNYNYVHIAAIDGAGNLGPTATMEMPKIANYTVSHQQEQLDGSYKEVEKDVGTYTIGQTIYPSVKTYSGFTSPEVQGLTISATGDNTLVYKYTRSSYDVLYIDHFDDGKDEITQTRQAKFEATVRGADLGNDPADNAIYKGYYYDHDTQAKVKVPSGSETYGATVYRYFKRRLISKSPMLPNGSFGTGLQPDGTFNGYVNWIDQSNVYGSRPSSVTVTLKQNEKINVEHIVNNVSTSSGMSVTGSSLTQNDENLFKFEGLPKYDRSGNEYTYTVEQSPNPAVSNHANDKYITRQNGYIFNNILQNNNNEDKPTIPDEDNPEDGDEDDKELPEEVGYTIRGNVEWVDNSDKLGLRPLEDLLTLEQWDYESEEYGEYSRITIKKVKGKNIHNYIFTNLPKYVYNGNSEVINPQVYRVVQTFTAKAIVNGDIVDVYSTSVETKYDASTNKPSGFDFTNTIKAFSGSILTLPEYDNTLKVETNMEEKTTVILRQLEASISGGDITYSDKYSDIYYNVEANNIPEILSHMFSGKYEVDVQSKDYILTNMSLTNYKDIELTRESNGKWYLTILSVPNDTYGTLNIELEQDMHMGFENSESFNNMFKIGLQDYEKYRLVPTRIVSPRIIF